MSSRNWWQSPLRILGSGFVIVVRDVEAHFSHGSGDQLDIAMKVLHAKCIDIHDPQSRVYELTDEYDGRRAVPKNFFMLLESYQNHPEAKSLGPDGKPCKADTRGLLQRAHIVANWPPIYIAKESDRHWEEGEDLSLLEFKTIEYKRKGYAIAIDEQLARIQNMPKREFIRRGINQHTLEKICERKPVRAIKLALCLKVLGEREPQNCQRVTDIK